VSSTLPEPVALEKERGELQAVLQSPLFLRSQTLARLLSYLCERTFAGESDHIKEYSIAVDVFGRPDSFDQDVDSIVRVQANRLRKRLAEYYQGEGAGHTMRITVPVGQYVPELKRSRLHPAQPLNLRAPRRHPWRSQQFVSAACGCTLRLSALLSCWRESSSILERTGCVHA